MDAKKAVQYASLLSELVHLTEKFVESEPELDNSRTAVTSNAEAPAQQQLVTLRLRTLKHELIIAPGSCCLSHPVQKLDSLHHYYHRRHRCLLCSDSKRFVCLDHDFTLVTVHNPNYVEPVAKALEAEE